MISYGVEMCLRSGAISDVWRSIGADGCTVSRFAKRENDLILSVDAAHQLTPWRQHVWLFPKQPRPRCSPTLPAQPYHLPNRVAHEYKRARALNLFAAFDTRSGKVYGPCYARQRQRECIGLNWKRWMRRLTSTSAPFTSCATMSVCNMVKKSENGSPTIRALSCTVHPGMVRGCIKSNNGAASFNASACLSWMLTPQITYVPRSNSASRNGINTRTHSTSPRNLWPRSWPRLQPWHRDDVGT